MSSSHMRPFAVTLAVLSGVALGLSACGSSSTSSGDGGTTEAGGTDSGTTDSGNPPGCPAAVPAGGACSLPSGTTCTYPGNGPCAGGTIATCMNGTWNIVQQGGVPGPSSCPATMPAQGSSCTPSCGAQLSCMYDCSKGGPAVAYCSGGVWQVQRMGGGCQVDGGTDSASDAAGD